MTLWKNWSMETMLFLFGKWVCGGYLNGTIFMWSLISSTAKVPPCNIWSWSLYYTTIQWLLLCTRHYFRYLVNKTGKKKLQALPSWHFHTLFLPGFCKYILSYFIAVIPLPSNTPLLLMFSEALITSFSRYMIFPCNLQLSPLVCSEISVFLPWPFLHSRSMWSGAYISPSGNLKVISHNVSWIKARLPFPSKETFP